VGVARTAGSPPRAVADHEVAFVAMTVMLGELAIGALDELGEQPAAVALGALAAAARRGDGAAHVRAAALGALDELGEQPAADHEVMLGELAIGAVVVATGSRWCGSPGPGAAAVVAIGVVRVLGAALGAAVAVVQLELGEARGAVVDATGSRWCGVRRSRSPPPRAGDRGGARRRPGRARRTSTVTSRVSWRYAS
jgi:hypothetical protein